MRVLLSLTVGLAVLAPGSTGHDLRRIPTSARGPTVSYAPPIRPTAHPKGEAKHRFPRAVWTTSKRFAIYPRPRARARVSLRARNPIDQRLVLMVRERRVTNSGSWFRVLLPVRPNGSSGWVRSRDVNVVRLRERISIDLSEHSLTYRRGLTHVVRFPVGIGTSSTPTPVGRFYVWARVPQPGRNGPYGVYALGLSAFSVLSDWPGGGRVAIHGTADPTDTGRAVSHGCIRVFNPDMRVLKRVPMGTPVLIHR
jgi:lipoprotein-anchoring transpeptidase ErfK/SrfK